MSIGYRVFVVEGNSVTPISQKTFDSFYSREQPTLPQYANQTINVTMAIYSLDHRRPKQIISMDNLLVRLNSEGGLDQDHHFESLRLAVDRFDGAMKNSQPMGGSLIDGVAQFNERRWKRLHPELSGLALKAILKKIFG